MTEDQFSFISTLVSVQFGVIVLLALMQFAVLYMTIRQDTYNKFFVSQLARLSARIDKLEEK